MLDVRMAAAMSTNAGHNGELGRIIRHRTIGVPPPYEGAVINAAREAYQAGRSRILRILRWAALIIAILIVAFGLLTGTAEANGCRPYPITEHSPTGIVGCVVYGEGIASRWPGPGICTPIVVTSLVPVVSLALPPGPLPRFTEAKP